MLAQRLISTIAALIISAGALWWLLSDGTGTALIRALGRASLWPLVLGALITIAIQIIRAWRFSILVNASLALPSWTMIGIATKLVFFNFILPFKLGELSFPLMMKRAYGTSLVQAAGILILCRFFDLGVVTAFILLAAAWLLNPAVYGWSPALISALGLFALAAPLLIVGSMPWLQRLTARWPCFQHLDVLLTRGVQMMSPPSRRLMVSALTLSIWIAHALIAWLIALAISAKFDFITMVMASASSNLAFALPISGVAGLGPPQAAWATMLHLAGHAWEPAITSALLCHGLLFMILSGLGAGFLIMQSLQTKPMIDDHGSACSASGR